MNLAMKASELGLDSDSVIKECQNIGGWQFSDSVFFFVCLKRMAQKISALERELDAARPKLPEIPKPAETVPATQDRFGALDGQKIVLRRCLRCYSVTALHGPCSACGQNTG